MSDLNKDTVKRIHALLSASVTPAQLTTIPLVQAAASAGDIEVLKAIFEAGGAAAFVGVDGKNSRIDALECAALANQVESIKWLLESGAIAQVDHSLRTDVNGDEVEIVCKAAKLAANAGAFEALVLIAGAVPKLKTRLMYGGLAGVFTVERTSGYTVERRTVSQAGLLGLMVGAIHIARNAGRDVAPMLEVVRSVVREGVVPLAEDISTAIRFDEPDAFAAMLGAGVKISPIDFVAALNECKVVAEVLRAFNDHVARTGAHFDDMFHLVDGREVVAYDQFTQKKTRYAKVSEVMTGLAGVARDARPAYGGTVAGEEALAEEVVRFLKLVMPDAVSPDMLARAAGADSFPLARRLLEEGVDPNVVPFWWENASLDGHAAIHRCTSAHMIRLLHKYGADVALPLCHSLGGSDKKIEGNLFTLMCAERDDADMIHAFAECGGDMGQKFGGRTLMQLASHRSERFKEAIRAVKSGLVISAAVDVSAGEMKPARSVGSSPL